MDRRPNSTLLALCLALGSCGPPGDQVDASAASEAPIAVARRSDDPRLVRLREAIEFGRLDLARTLLDQVEVLAGSEAPLLRARLALHSGDALGALREVEAARSRAPLDGRVFACAAEIYAGLGRFEAAAEELALGLAAAGRTADLERATGVTLILQPGGAGRGLNHLRAAREADPTLAFTSRPLSQAYLLEGRRLLAEGDHRAALAATLSARELDPLELSTLELEADCRAALNDFDAALALYAEIEQAGKPTADLRAHLHHRAATFELFHKNRTRALDHYRQARELGLDDESLGFGAALLREEAERCVERGIEAYDEGDYSAAGRAFEEALEVDTGHIAARNHLGVALFRRGEYEAAATCWTQVLEAARRGEIDLPEPVEINLTRALKLAGHQEQARRVIEGFLERQPQSAWAPEARELLDRL